MSEKGALRAIARCPEHPYQLLEKCKWCYIPHHITNNYVHCQHPYSSIHRHRIVLSKFCPNCHQVFLGYHNENSCKIRVKREAEERAKQEIMEKQIEKNLKILDSCEKRTMRYCLAIYRLYRYCNYTPKDLAAETDLAEASVRAKIGQTFKILCIEDKTCVFRTVWA